ncbi:hypothetical protein B0H13DRAFT_2497566 [Mycena leptocephala]|nr:hypothetical protein B0H13DRAFT_2497566 [Mycena leptocephala]
MLYREIHKATKPEPTTKNSSTAELALAASLFSPSLSPGSSSDKISVTARAQQPKAELPGRNASSPNPPRSKGTSKGTSISVDTAPLPPASFPFLKPQTQFASTPSLPFPACASSCTLPSGSLLTTGPTIRSSRKPPTSLIPPAVPPAITKAATPAIPSPNPPAPAPAPVDAASVAGSAPPQALECRHLQPPARYSGLLPEPNTRRSQRDRRVHVQSSSIPAESSSSRITPTDQLRIPVFGNTERESRRRSAVTAETEPLSVLPENAFLLSLAKRWKEPPLSYYIMVAENAANLLQRLAEWPTALAHHPTSAVPNYEEFPSSSFVVEDLLAMDRSLIHYQELCAQDSTPTDTVSAALDMLFKSHLMQPCCTGQRIISTSKIVATDKGMLRCRLDWRPIVQQLGAGFAFGDYRWQHTPEELGKIFPPTSPKSGKSAHERAQYLDRRGKEPWVASVRTPPGWLSDIRVDGGHRAI